MPSIQQVLDHLLFRRLPRHHSDPIDQYRLLYVPSPTDGANQTVGERMAFAPGSASYAIASAI